MIDNVVEMYDDGDESLLGVVGGSTKEKIQEVS